jgi:serine/threonine-protein kinase
MAESGRRIAKHYELGRELGAGRAGRVFAARDLRTGADVAVKLRDADDDSPLDVESAGLRQLEHPNLLRILDAGRDGGQRFIVSELVREGALIALPKPLAAEALHALTSQMLDALAFLHAHGILHGDIKTENVLVASLAPPQFKLSDSASHSAVWISRRGRPVVHPHSCHQNSSAVNQQTSAAISIRSE